MYWLRVLLLAIMSMIRFSMMTSPLLPLAKRLTLLFFPLLPGRYYMPYPFADGEGSDPPKYIREEWDGAHAPEDNILSKEIFKDPHVRKRALDQTITPAKLKRTESLLPL
ncbi:hypothetical protein Tco_1486301 [Tanacetum coccineum]